MVNIVMGAVFSPTRERTYLAWISPFMVIAAILGRTRHYRVGCGIALGSTFALITLILVNIGGRNVAVIIPLTYFTATILMMSFLLKFKWLVFLAVLQTVLVVVLSGIKGGSHEVILGGWLPMNVFVLTLILISRRLQDRNVRRIRDYQGNLEGLVEKRSQELREANRKLEERLEREREISRSLETAVAQKDVLLKELYHRTKNNMQVISSLLHIQSLRCQDPEVRSLFDAARGRIQSMALVHEKLLNASDLSFIDLKEYLKDLTTELLRTHSLGQDVVVIAMNAEPVPISIDQAVPLGLAVNELLSNAMKYAFTDGRRGRIEIEVAREPDGSVRIVIRDDGPGLPEGKDPRTGEGLGIKLIEQIVGGQLKGSFSLVSEGGVQAR